MPRSTGLSLGVNESPRTRFRLCYVERKLALSEVEWVEASLAKV